MPTYPTLRIAVDSDPEVLDGREESRADDGSVYVRNLYAADRYVFPVRHPALNASEAATLVAFYAANRTGTFDFYWPPDAYTYTGVMFGRGGLRKKWVGPGLYDYTVRLLA